MSRSELADIPECLITRAMDREISENWAVVTDKVEAINMPNDENILSTHFFFKIKKDEGGKRKLKDRLVVHGNRDDEKEEVRKEAIAADMINTRLVLELGMMMGFTFGVADIKGAYMKSGPAPRDIYIYIIPPATYKRKQQVYWKLLALAYGVCDAGRQWIKISDVWMKKENGNAIFGPGTPGIH